MAETERANVLDHLAAVVDLGDDAVGLVLAIERDCVPCPLRRRVAPGIVAEHITSATRIFGGENNAGLVGVLAA